MQETTARKLKQKTVAGIFMLAVMLFLLTGCGTSSVFDGSRASDDGHASAKRRGALADGGHLRGEGRERGPGLCPSGLLDLQLLGKLPDFCFRFTHSGPCVVEVSLGSGHGICVALHGLLESIALAFQLSDLFTVGSVFLL